jgi:hypothetical protein
LNCAFGSNKFEFSITLEDVYNLWIKQDKKCALTGIPIDFKNQNFRQLTERPSHIKHKKKFKYDLICTASLDRINSDKGYIKDNIQLVHKDINMMKNDYDQDYFINMCNLISNNFK